MESTTFYRIQIDEPNVLLFISENGFYKSGSKRVTVQLRTAVNKRDQKDISPLQRLFKMKNSKELEKRRN